MSDEADNLVLRHLREMRSDMTKRFDEADVRLVKIEGRLSDLTGVMHDTRTDVLGLAERLEHIETGLRVAERLAALEAQTGEIASLRQQLAELQRRVG
ncbi:MAG TPA: hypothetical protein VMT03_02060 [Polyangia bacterium]|nr:hypothetical protein [Polyangia bacterium]